MCCLGLAKDWFDCFVVGLRGLDVGFWFLGVGLDVGLDVGLEKIMSVKGGHYIIVGIFQLLIM